MKVQTIEDSKNNLVAGKPMNPVILTQSLQNPIQNGKLSLIQSNLLKKKQNESTDSGQFETKTVQKDTLTEIKLKETHVNIYALKELLSTNQSSLKRVLLHDCSFYQTDKDTIKHKNSCKDHFMFREINFCLLIKTFQLEQIGEIDIKLKKYESKSQQNPRNSQQKINPSKSLDQHPYKSKLDILKEEFNCNEQSRFMEFETKKLSNLNEKYDSQEKHESRIESIIGGEIKKKIESEDLIDQLVVDEIQNYVRIFKDHIKNCFKDETLIIKSFALENPIAKTFLINVLKKNNAKIEYIIFKDTGTIIDSAFKSFATELHQLKNLKCLSFICSQIEDNSYQNLQFLIQEKGLSYLILYRSAFVLSKLFTKNPNQQMLDMKYYGFYFIQISGKYINFHQLSPNMFEYANELKQLKTEQTSDEKVQRVEKRIQILNKIIKKQIYLLNSGIAEQVMFKYFEKLQNKAEEFDQIELQMNLRILIKYNNPYSANMIEVLISKLQNQTLRQQFEREFQSHYGEQKQKLSILNAYHLYSLFLFESNYKFQNKQYILQIDRFKNNHNYKKREKYQRFNENKPGFSFKKNYTSEQEDISTCLNGFTKLKLMNYRYDDIFVINLDEENKSIENFSIKIVKNQQFSWSKFLKVLMSPISELSFLEVQIIYDRGCLESIVDILQQKQIQIDILYVKSSESIKISQFSNVKKLVIMEGSIKNDLPTDNILTSICLKKTGYYYANKQKEAVTVFKNLNYQRLTEFVISDCSYLMNEKTFDSIVYDIMNQRKDMTSSIYLEVKFEEPTLIKNCQRLTELKNVDLNLKNLSYQTCFELFNIYYSNENQEGKDEQLRNILQSEVNLDNDLDYDEIHTKIKLPEQYFFLQSQQNTLKKKKNKEDDENENQHINYQDTIDKDMLFIEQNIPYYFQGLLWKNLPEIDLDRDYNNRIDKSLKDFLDEQNKMQMKNNEYLQRYLEKMKNQLDSFKLNFGECCQNHFNLKELQKYQQYKENFDLTQHFQEQEQICLFKSIYYKPNQLQKIYINFNLCFDNTKNPFNSNSINIFSQITKIDFSYFIFSSSFQFKFISYVIKSSPNLKNLKLKKIKVLCSHEEFLQPINQSLDTLDLSQNNVDEIKGFLESLSSQKNLKKLNLQKLVNNQNDQSVLNLIQQNVEALQILYCHELHYQFIDKSISDNTFQNLQVLKIELNHNSNLDLNIKMPKLRDMCIQFYDLSQDQIHKIINQFFGKVQTIKFEAEEKRTKTQYRMINLQRESSTDTIIQLIVPKKYETNVKPDSSYKKYDGALSSERCSGQIQELYIIDGFELKNLQEVFNQNSTSLLVLNIKLGAEIDLDKKNQFLACLNQLPISIKILNLSENYWLDSLDGLILNEGFKKYNIKELNISQTSISHTKALEYTQHVKQVKYWNFILPSIKELQQVAQILCCDPSEILKILRNIQKGKINLSQYIEYFEEIYRLHSSQKIPYQFQNGDNSVYIVSPTNTAILPTYLQTELREKDSFLFQISDLYSARRFENKYQLYLSGAVNKPSYILGYSKDHPNFNSKFDFNKIYIDLKNEQNEDNQIIENMKNFILLDRMIAKSDVKKVYLQHSITINFSYCKLLNISEFSLINLLNKIPPCEASVSDMSIQFIKTLYVINFLSPLFYKVSIDYNKNEIFNDSIANNLFVFFDRKYFKRANGEKSIWTSLLNVTRLFFKAFSVEPQKYRFDEGVYALAKQLDHQIKRNKHYILLLFFPIYLFVCAFGIIYISLLFDVTCGHGISWYSYIFYAVFGLVTSIIEFYLFRNCLKYVSHLIPALETSVDQGSISKLVNNVKQKIIDTPWINQYLLANTVFFMQSQIARFDNFTNVGFLYQTYRCHDFNIFYIGLFFILIPMLFQVYQFFSIVILSLKKRQTLVTGSLDTYYKICSVLSFQAASNILNQVSPANSIIIKGRMFNSAIIGQAISVIGESIPLTIMQIYNLSQRNNNSSLILSLIISILTLLQLIYGLLTLCPSNLSQEDFIKINENKQQVAIKYNKELEEYENDNFELRMHEHFKRARSQKYLKQQVERLKYCDKIEIIKFYKNFNKNKAFQDQSKIYFESVQELEK